MDAFEEFGPRLVAFMTLFAIVYGALSFAPVWWPAIVAWRARPTLPRKALFVGVTAALVYGTLLFLALAVFVPVLLYGVYVAPQLEASRVPGGTSVLRVAGFVNDYWGWLVPPIQLALTWYLTRTLSGRWVHICAALASTPAAGAAFREAGRLAPGVTCAAASTASSEAFRPARCRTLPATPDTQPRRRSWLATWVADGPGFDVPRGMSVLSCCQDACGNRPANGRCSCRIAIARLLSWCPRPG